MLLLAEGGPSTILSEDEVRRLTIAAFKKLGDKERVLIIPPDFTRYHSLAGEYDNDVVIKLGF